MPIKITLGELVASKDSWQKLAAFGAELPIKTAYWIGKQIKAVEKEIRDYEVLHNEQVKKFGTPVEGRPNALIVKPENMEEFMKVINELRAVEVGFEFEPFSLVDLGAAKLPIRDLILLDKFLKE
jgi:hypothetical protein